MYRCTVSLPPLYSNETNQWSRFSARARRLALFLVLGTNLLITGLGTYSSIHNYPGGEAMAILSTLKIDSLPKSIHIDSPSAMTGASLFTHYHSSSPFFPTTIESNWSYNRSETITQFDQFDYLISGTKERAGFEVLKGVKGFAGWSKTGARMEEQLWILQRMGE